MVDERSCSNCYYSECYYYAYPCNSCIRGISPEDLWRPKVEPSVGTYFARGSASIDSKGNTECLILERGTSDGL